MTLDINVSSINASVEANLVDVTIIVTVDPYGSTGTGEGLPVGGDTGDVLTKNSSVTGDVKWAAPTGGGSGEMVTKTNVSAAIDLFDVNGTIIDTEYIALGGMKKILFSAFKSVITALFPTTLPASDVYAWAKASVKPAYNFSELGNKPTSTTGYGLPDYPTTLPASDVSAWAKAATKPSYNFSEIGNTPTTTAGYGLPSYPTTLPASDVSAWAKAGTKPSYDHSELGSIQGGAVGDYQHLTSAQVALIGTGGGGEPVTKTNVSAAIDLFDIETTVADTEYFALGGMKKILFSALKTLLGSTFEAKIATKFSAYNKAFGILTDQIWGFDSHPTTVAGYGLPAYPTTLPASDVSAWAKAASKPSYAFSEITDKPTTVLGYGLPAYPTTLPASDVSAWAKAATKPSYNFSEIGNTPTTTAGYGLPAYPTTLPASDVSAWAKAGTKPSYDHSELGSIQGGAVGDYQHLTTAQLNSLSAIQAPTFQTLTDAANIAWNGASGFNAIVTLTATRVLSNPTNLVDGKVYTLLVKQNGTGGYGLTYGAYFKFPSAVAPVLTSTASACDIMQFVAEGTTILRLINFISDSK